MGDARKMCQVVVLDDCVISSTLTASVSCDNKVCEEDAKFSNKTSAMQQEAVNRINCSESVQLQEYLHKLPSLEPGTCIADILGEPVK
jgi:hypothetical protein